MSEALKKIDEFRNNILRDLLSQCTESEVEKFNRMYGSIDHIINGSSLNDNRMESISRIEWAIQQCERTIEKKKAKI